MSFEQKNTSVNLTPEQINPVQIELYKILGIAKDNEKLIDFVKEKSATIREIIQNNKDIIKFINEKKFREVAEIVAKELEKLDDSLIKKQAA